MTEVKELIPLSLLVTCSSLPRGKNDSDASYISKVTHLNLSGKKLDFVNNLEGCTSIRALFLSDNNIKNIMGISHLKYMTMLHLESNQLTEISGLDSLTKLEKLYLDNNKISRLQGLENLKELHELYLNHQKHDCIEFTFEENSIKNLTSLSVLSLVDCKVKEYDYVVKNTLTFTVFLRCVNLQS